MLVTFNKIVMTGVQDDYFILKIFNDLSALDYAYFFYFIKKKRDTLEEDQLEDELDTMIDACIKKCSNITSKWSIKKNASAGNHEDDGEYKFMALLANVLPSALTTTFQQKPNPLSNEKPFNNFRSLHSSLKT